MKLYSRQEAAAILKVHVNTLDKWRKEGRIGFYQPRPGCKVMFTEAHLEKFLSQMEHIPRSKRRS